MQTWEGVVRRPIVPLTAKVGPSESEDGFDPSVLRLPLVRVLSRIRGQAATRPTMLTHRRHAPARCRRGG